MNFSSRCVLLRGFKVFKKCVRFTNHDVIYNYEPGRCPTIRYFFSSAWHCFHPDNQNGTVSNEAEEFELEDSSPYSDVDYKAITGGDPEKLKKLLSLQLEIDMMRQKGDNVPHHLKTSHWIRLLNINGQFGRINYLSSLWILEMKQIGKREKSETYLKLLAEKKKADAGSRLISITTSSPIRYDLSYNSLFQRIYPSRMDRFLNYKLFKSMVFEIPILVDCGYESFMNEKFLNFCGQQIQRMWSVNRAHRSPHHLIFCNLDPCGNLIKRISLTFPVDNPDFPFFHTSKSYQELFPKERLVYLTPDSKTELVQHNPNDVYIIGALVDKGCDQPLARSKAKKENLRTARFPLEKYLNWGFGSKALNLDTVMMIMNDLKAFRKWEIAFKNVPRCLLKEWKTTKMEIIDETNDTTPWNKTITDRNWQNQMYDLLLKNRKNSRNENN